MIFWKKAGTLRARMYFMTRSSAALRSSASTSVVDSADDAAPMMTEYITRPSRIMTTEKMASDSYLGMMFMPTDVVADTAHMTAIQYCCSTGWFAHIGCGSHWSARLSCKGEER